jgi:hypothetical protein
LNGGPPAKKRLLAVKEADLYEEDSEDSIPNFGIDCKKNSNAIQDSYDKKHKYVGNIY